MGSSTFWAKDTKVNKVPALFNYPTKEISRAIGINLPLSNSFRTDLLLSRRRFFEPPQGTVLPPLEEFNLDDGTHYQRR